MNLYQFIKFLTKYFSDKQIEKLFISYQDSELFWLHASVSMFYEIANDADNLKSIIDVVENYLSELKPQ